MAIKVTYPDGRTITVDNRNRKTETNAQGNKVIRVVKVPVKSGGYSLKNYYDLPASQRKQLNRQLFQESQVNKAQQQKAAVAEAVIRSLEASKRRTQAKKERTLTLLKTTVTGRAIERSLSLQSAKNYLNSIKNAPYSNNYKQEIRTWIKQQENKRNPEKGYGRVILDGVVFFPESKKEARYLKDLKKTIERDEALKREWANTLKKSNLTVKKGDKWYIKAYKGAGITGLGLLKSGRFIGNASDKLQIAIRGIGASRRARQAVGSEAARAAKETPKTLAESFDPRKPENWANIIVVAIAVNSLAQSSLSKGASTSKLKSAETKVTKSLSKIKAAKKAAAKAPKKNASILKKLSKQERALKVKKAALAKELRKAINPKKVKVKFKKVKVKTPKKIELFSKLKAKLARAKNAYQARKTLRLARKSGFSLKELKKMEKQYLKAKRAETSKAGAKALEAAKAKGKAKASKAKAIKKLDKQASKALKKAEALDLKARRLAARRQYKEALKAAKEQGRLTKLAAKQARKTLRLARKSGFSKSYLKKLENNYLKAKRVETKSLSAKLLKEAKARGKAKQIKVKVKTYPKKALKARREAAAKEGAAALRKAKAKGKAKKATAKEQTKLIREGVKLRKKAARQAPKVDAKLARIAKLEKDIKIILDQLERLSPAKKAAMRLKAAMPTKAAPKVLEVGTANGQVLLLAAPSVKVTGAVTVKPTVLRGATTYYTAVLSQIKIGKPPKTTPKKAAALHKNYYDLYRYGSVKPVFKAKPEIGTSPFSAIGRASRTGQSNSLRQGTSVANKIRQEVLTRQAQGIIAKISSLQATRVSLSRVQQLLLKLEKILLRLRKIKKGFKLRFPKRKKRLTKKQAKDWEELLKKVKRKYRPSLAAILFGIYGYKPKSITGFELRPILKKKPKKVVKRGKRRKKRRK